MSSIAVPFDGVPDDAVPSASEAGPAPKRIVVLGGAGVVHESVVQALKAYID